jgi:hypothetical protein
MNCNRSKAASSEGEKRMVRDSKSSFPNRLFKIRWLNHLLPLHHRQHQMRMSPSSNCPSNCGCTSEDDAHLLRCPHPDRQLHISNLLRDLRTLFDRHHVDPWLRQILFSVIVGIHPLTTCLQPRGSSHRPTGPRAARPVLRGLPSLVGHTPGSIPQAPTEAKGPEPGTLHRGTSGPSISSHRHGPMGHSQRPLTHIDTVPSTLLPRTPPPRDAPGLRRPATDTFPGPTRHHQQHLPRGPTTIPLSTLK